MSLLALAGCDQGKKSNLPPLPDINPGGVLPKDGAGRPLLIQVAGSALSLDFSAPDAINALGTCADLLTYCVDATRTLDTCMAGVTVCPGKPAEAKEPCCPQKCVDEYDKARKAGTAPIAAFDEALFGAQSCLPDARQLAGVTP